MRNRRFLQVAICMVSEMHVIYSLDALPLPLLPSKQNRQSISHSQSVFPTTVGSKASILSSNQAKRDCAMKYIRNPADWMHPFFVRVQQGKP